MDEPRFGSTATYERVLGTDGHVYPWSEEVPGLLEEELGERWACLLPLLWSRENALGRDVQYALCSGQTWYTTSRPAASKPSMLRK